MMQLHNESSLKTFLPFLAIGENLPLIRYGLGTGFICIKNVSIYDESRSFENVNREFLKPIRTDMEALALFPVHCVGGVHQEYNMLFAFLGVEVISLVRIQLRPSVLAEGWQE